MSDITPSTCSETDINTAIASAVTGDRIRLDLVSGGCTPTWTAALTTLSGKDITLYGDGSGITGGGGGTWTGNVVVTLDNAAVTGQWLSLGTTASRVTGIHFKLMNSITAILFARGQNFRIDNNKFENLSSTSILRAVHIAGDSSSGIAHPTGVLDHNSFVKCYTDVRGDLALIANAIWDDASTIGAASQTGVVFIEDNYFDGSGVSSQILNCVDSQYGGRYVFRYNTGYACAPTVHSMQTNDRGARSWEIYENTFSSRDTGSCANWIALIRGGTGVMFNNTATGTNYCSGTPLQLDNVRSFTVLGGSFGSCDGTSAADQNTVGETGWRCRDQIGAGADSALSVGTTLESQASEPAYFWSNTLNSNPINPTVVNNGAAVKTGGSSADIRLNTDYFNSAKVGYTPFAYPYCVSGNGSGCAAGAGCIATLSPSSLDIGSVRPGLTSGSAFITLRNTGSASCTITSISINSTTPAIFTQTNDCGGTLAVDATCTITVTLVANTSGAMAQHTLTVDVATGSDSTATLDGTGLTIQQNLRSWFFQ